jgi:ferredoxin
MNARRSFFDSGYRVEIDRTVCDAHGTCAELLPELITLDEWGYPIIAAGNVPELLQGDARRAVESCPIVALRLAKMPQAQPETRPDRQAGVPPWPPRPPQQPPRKSMPRKR